MSTEELVRRYYPVVDAGDPHAVVALFSDDAVYRRPGYPPLAGTAALLAFYEQDRVIVEGRHTVHQVVVDGNRAAVQGSFAGVLKDGTKPELDFADFFEVDDDGRFSSRTTYFFAPLV